MSHILFCEFRNLHFKILLNKKKSKGDFLTFLENLNKFNISVFFINKKESHFYFKELKK